MTDFKYNNEIKSLIEKGIELPILFEPVNQDAYRYVFDVEHPNNHKPVYVHKPQRIISDIEKNQLNTSGYALSCFDKEDNATQKYESLKKHFSNIAKALGSAMCYGILDETDGLITEINNEGHFDLYEFYECNLSSKFTIKKILL